MASEFMKEIQQEDQLQYSHDLESLLQNLELNRQTKNSVNLVLYNEYFDRKDYYFDLKKGHSKELRRGQSYFSVLFDGEKVTVAGKVLKVLR